MIRWLVALVLFAAPRAADACSVAQSDLFTTFDSAVTVAVVHVTNPPANLGKETAKVEMIVDKMIKGPAAKTLPGMTNGFCGPVFKKDEKVIAFFRGDKQLGIARSIGPVTEALGKWVAAKDRKKLLDELAKSSDAEVAESAKGRQTVTLPAWMTVDKKWKSTAAAALARAKTLWKDMAVLDPHLADYDLKKCKPLKMKCADGATRIRDTMGKDNDPSLFGSLDALDKGAQCWNVSCPLGFNTIETYFSTTDGALLLLWEIPEG